MFIKKLLLTISVLFSIACSCYSQSNIQAEGFWKARGYGWIAEINSENVQLYDFTKISCYPTVTYPLTVFSDGISVDNGILILKRGVTQYTFDHIDELPELCLKKLTKKEQNDPILNFEILWRTFQEQYAYFKERDVDWKALYAKYREQINSAKGNAQLFVICQTMLQELNDEHLGLEAADKIMKKAAMLENLDSKPKPDISGARRAIVTKYLKNPKTHNISRTIWGKINDSIGYIQLNSMGAQGDYGITATTPIKEAQKLYLKYLKRNPDVFGDDNRGMKKIMEKVLSDLGDTKKIILDLRFNGGGEDMVGLIALVTSYRPKRRYFIRKTG